jgi:hypothetical protein
MGLIREFLPSPPDANVDSIENMSLKKMKGQTKNHVDEIGWR